MSVAASYIAGTSDTSDSTTYTFASQSLGDADAARHIVVAVEGRGTVGSAISSATIAGVSATIVVQRTNSASFNNVAALLIAAVPSGTTGTIAVTFNGGMLRCRIQVYSLVGIDNITASDTDSSTANDPSVSLDVPAGGVAIGASLTTIPTTCSWVGITEDDDTQVESVITCTSAHSVFVTQQTGLTVTANYVLNDSTYGSTGVFASWGAAAGGARRLVGPRFSLAGAGGLAG